MICTRGRRCASTWDSRDTWRCRPIERNGIETSECVVCSPWDSSCICENCCATVLSLLSSFNRYNTCWEVTFLPYSNLISLFDNDHLLWMLESHLESITIGDFDYEGEEVNLMSQCALPTSSRQPSERFYQTEMSLGKVRDRAASAHDVDCGGDGGERRNAYIT